MSDSNNVVEMRHALMQRTLNAATRASAIFQDMTRDWKRLGVRERAIKEQLDEICSTLSQALGIEKRTES